jgi:DNA gyrase/topoisomerase IV subunit A
MPVDVPEEEWDNLQIVFATSDGDVRQNDLSDFTNVMRNGKIAMKLPEGVTLVNAAIADENDDVMLVTAAGRAIRFSTTEIRVFKGRGFDRRARHPPGRGRQRRLHVDHPPFRGRARGTRRLSQAAPPDGRRDRGRGGRRRRNRGRGQLRPNAMPRCRRPRT